MDVKTDKWADRQSDGRMGRWAVLQTDRQQTKESIDSQMEKKRDTLIGNIMGENMSGQTDRVMEAWTDGHSYRRTDKQTKGWIDRQSDGKTERH
jgi:hypothetical protein